MDGLMEIHQYINSHNRRHCYNYNMVGN